MTWLGVFIAPTTSIVVGKAASDGRTGQSGAPPERYCALSGALPRQPTVRVHSRLTVRGLSSCGTEQSGATPDSPVPYRTVRCPLTSEL
jgi:hypothetical protein